jgi:hypothetical protein
MFRDNVEHDFSSQRKHSSHDESARVMVGSELSDHNDMHPDHGVELRGTGTLS